MPAVCLGSCFRAVRQKKLQQIRTCTSAPEPMTVNVFTLRRVVNICGCVVRGCVVRVRVRVRERGACACACTRATLFYTSLVLVRVSIFRVPTQRTAIRLGY